VEETEEMMTAKAESPRSLVTPEEAEEFLLTHYANIRGKWEVLKPIMADFASHILQQRSASSEKWMRELAKDLCEDNPMPEYLESIVRTIAKHAPQQEAASHFGLDPAHGRDFTAYYCNVCGASSEPCKHILARIPAPPEEKTA
jgi:hypothetical protein